MGAAPQEVPGSPHLGRIDIGLWEHATAEQGRNLLRIDLVIFGLAAMDGFHIESVSKDKGNPFVRTEVGQPIPGKDAFDRHNETVPTGGNGVEKRSRRGFHIAVEHDFSVVVHDTDVHTPGMQVDTAVKWVLIVVESHEASSSFVSDLVSKSAYHWGYAEGEASIIIKGVQPTPYSVRSAPASRRS